MSQSPLSRAIRELERELGVVLFVRTTRRVELTRAGSLLLERARQSVGRDRRSRRGRAAFEPVRRRRVPAWRTVRSARQSATRIVEALRAERPECRPRLVQEVTPDSLRRVGAHELAAAVVMESPAAARRYGVRIDALKDEPLLAALPRSHRYAAEPAIPIGEFVAEPVLLPREPPGLMFNAWLRSVVRAHGFELEQHDGDRQRAVGSALATGRKRRGGGGDGGRLGGRAGRRSRRGAVRPAAELSDGPRFALAAHRGSRAASCRRPSGSGIPRAG